MPLIFIMVKYDNPEVQDLKRKQAIQQLKQLEEQYMSEQTKIHTLKLANGEEKKYLIQKLDPRETIKFIARKKEDDERIDYVTEHVIFNEDGSKFDLNAFAELDHENGWYLALNQLAGEAINFLTGATPKA